MTQPEKSKVLTDILERAYHSSTRRTWIVYREAARIFGTYSRGPESTRALAQKLGVSAESIGNWSRAGFLRRACLGLRYQDESGREWTFYDLRQALGPGHFQVAGRALQREDFGPEELMEWLALAAIEGKSAEWLAAQALPAAANQFEKRLEKLLRTDPPEDWPTEKRRAVRLWLETGRELVERS